MLFFPAKATSNIQQAYLIKPPAIEVVLPELTLKEKIIIQAKEKGLDPDLVLKIATCESSLKPNAVGVQAVVGRDYGLLQINSYWHETEMRRRGLSITVWEDSLTYGLDLLRSEGTRHWNASKACWNK